MKKIISLVLCLMLLLGALCGCEDDKTVSSDPAVSSTASENETSSADTSADEEALSSEETVTDGTDSEGTTAPEDTEIETVPVVDTSTENEGKEDGEEEEEKPLRERLRGGINLSSIEETVVKDPERYVYNSKYYEIVAKAGFDHVRLPVGMGSMVVGEAPEYLLDVEALRYVDMAIDCALDAGLVVVLDNHHGSRYTEPEVFKRIWEQIAERYQNYPEELFFELVNEPTAGAEYLNKLQMETVPIIRKTNPTRTIALAADQYNSPNKLWSVEIPPDDENIIISIHHYNPLGFLRQGKNWGGSNFPTGVKYTESTKNAATEYLELCADYEKRTGRTVWISEWGAYLDGGMDHEDAAKYYKHFTEECARLDLAYAYWELHSGFGIFDMATEQWDEQLYGVMTITW